MNVAIVGAGFSGCLLFNRLKENGFDITIFDKSRGTGGRLSTKYIEDKFIDHGTPFIKTQDKFLIEFLDEKVLENLLNKKNNEYFPINGINKLCSSMIDKSSLIKNSRIKKAFYENKKWTLIDENQQLFEGYDFLVLTNPAKQILELDLKLSENIKNSLESVYYDSIVSLICYSNKNCGIDLSKLENNKNIKKVVNNSLKYEYKDFDSYIIHFNEEFSNKYCNNSKEEIFDKVYNIINKELDTEIKKSFETIEHLWKYAFAKNSLNKDFLFDESIMLGVCGDYFKYKNLESSFHSSLKLSEKITILQNNKETKC